MNPVLSICIPTYNRKDKVCNLIDSILKLDENFEICVHIDGSIDGTFETLSNFKDSRLKITTSQNKGRHSAILAAVKQANGEFIMIFDDDDSLFLDGLKTIMSDCVEKPIPDIAGRIYHMNDEKGKIIGGLFPSFRSNFLALRADFGVHGDKKEVVLSRELKKVAQNTGWEYRRVPTSLFWSKMALTKDILCRNVVVGRKHYLHNGMSDNIVSLKKENAWPIVLLYFNHIKGFFKGRYRSVRYLSRAIIKLCIYSYYSMMNGIKNSGVR